jgi:hypothetical protein
MSAPEREDEFEAYLQRRVPLHRRVPELESPEPPEDLDRIVLRKARRAIRGARQVPVFRAPRWALPVGLAASLLLILAVGVDVGLRIGGDRQLAATALEPAPAHLKAVPAVAAGTSAAVSGGITTSRRTDDGIRTDHDMAANKVARAASPVRTPHAPRIPLVAAAKAAPAAAPVSAPPSLISVTALDATDSRVQPMDRSRAPPLLSEATRTQSGTDSRTREAKTAAPADGKAPGAPATSRDRAAWLRRIEALRTAGRNGEADREYERFRSVYPEDPQPASAAPAAAPK